MSEVVYKVYRGENKEIVYMTFNIDEAVRKYFMFIRENSMIQIWNSQRLIGEYSQSIFDLKVIKHNLEKIVEAA